jgi:crotonobetainyl-CoA:carnitine CoA-transferase CaiB-like acyl-CoA transferase
MIPVDKQNPFSAIKIIGYGEGVSAAFGTKLLADLGGEVIKVESPEGDVIRRRGPFPQKQADQDPSGLLIYLNTNKRGAVADLRTDAGRKVLHNLLKDADVLIHNVATAQRAQYGLDSKALSAAYPRLVATSISIFGDCGPRANYKAYDMNAAHASGWAFLSPGVRPTPICRR